MEIVLASDLAVAAEHATFSLPEPRVGLAAIYGGGIQRLVHQIPFKQAMRLILTGQKITAQQALEMGIVNEVVRLIKYYQKHVNWLRKLFKVHLWQ
jgi:enoyl-CoA hydratase/carnithine racemase